jgi:phage host-nuclease inhibitor protein Gam
VDRLIGLMAETEAELAALQAEADERVREVSEAFNQRRGSLAELLADLGSAVETYAIGHREDLGAERSMALAHGRAGWRWAPPSVRFTKTVDEVVAILEARGLDIAILVTKRPSREVLLTLPEKVLKKLPVRISRREDFYVEYAAASVSEAPPSP